MADAVQEFQPDDEVMKGVHEVDYSEDPVEDDADNFDLDSLECVDICDDLKSDRPHKRNSRRRRDRKRAYPSQQNEVIKKQMNILTKDTREEVSSPMIPPLAELELVDCCDADDSDVRSRPSTSQESRSLISESIHSADEEDEDSTMTSEKDADEYNDEYEDEDFPSLDEEIDVEAMKKASMINSDIPIRLDCSYDQRNGAAKNVTKSSNNIEVSRKSGGKTEDLQATAAVNDDQRKSTSSQELDSKERDRNRQNCREAGEASRRSGKQETRNVAPSHQGRNHSQSRKRRERISRPEGKEDLKDGCTPPKVPSNGSNASFMRNHRRPSRERIGNQRRDGGSSSIASRSSSSSNNNNTYKSSSSSYRSHGSTTSSNSPSAVRGKSDLPELTIQCSKRGGRIVVPSKNFRRPSQSSLPNVKSRRITG